jgi:hypothetical protein
MADVNYLDLPKLAPKIMDLILSANNAFAVNVLSSSPQDWQSIQYKKAIQVTKPTTQGSFSGMDSFNVSQQDTNQQLTFNPAFYYQSIVLADTDIAKNQSDPNAAVNLLTAKIEEGTNAMVDSIGDLFYLDGTGNSSKDFLGLKAIVDDGTVASTYGGLSRTTYTSLRATRTAVGAGLTTLSTIGTAEFAAKKGSDVVDLHVTTNALWQTLEGLIPLTQYTNVQSAGYAQATRLGKVVRDSSALGANIGLNAIMYRGKPVIADDKCTANYWYGLNMKRLNWYGLQMKGQGWHAMNFGGNKELEGVYEGMDSKNVGLSMTDMKMPVDQAGRVGQIFLGGNLLSFAPNRHFVLIFT